MRQDVVIQFFQTSLKTQDFKPEQIVNYRQRLIERLVRHARANVPFYRDSGRLAPLFRADGSFDPAGWTKVPLLGRAEAHDAGSALSTDNVPPEMRPLTPDNTSGSTGTPLPFKRTMLASIVSQGLLARAVTWHLGPQPGAIGPIVNLRYDDPGEPPAGPGAEHEFFNLSVALPIAEQVARLRTIRPRLIITYPNLALAWLEAGGADVLGSLKALVLTGEVLTPDAREILARATRAALIEAYSCSEIGPIAFDGGDRTLRVCEENVLLELPEGRVDPAQTLPVIVTPLYAYATPLIRYMPGDHVRVSARTVKQATGLRRLSGVVGRTRNLFRRRDGSTFLANIAAAKLSREVRYRGWQLIQHDFEAFEMKVIFDATPTAAEMAAMHRLVTRAIGVGEVTITPVETIEDDRGTGKAIENYLCRIPGFA